MLRIIPFPLDICDLKLRTVELYIMDNVSGMFEISLIILYSKFFVFRR